MICWTGCSQAVSYREFVLIFILEINKRSYKREKQEYEYPPEFKFISFSDFSEKIKRCPDGKDANKYQNKAKSSHCNF
jgi:hypothetical protein